MTGFTFESKQLAKDRLWLKVSGGLSAASAEELKAWLVQIEAIIATMHQDSGAGVSCVFDLVDLTEANDPVVINALVEFQKQNKPHIRRTALVIKDPQVRLAMSIVGALADRYNIRSFASNQEAEGWAFSEQA